MYQLLTYFGGKSIDISGFIYRDSIIFCTSDERYLKE